MFTLQLKQQFLKLKLRKYKYTLEKKLPFQINAVGCYCHQALLIKSSAALALQNRLT